MGKRHLSARWGGCDSCDLQSINLGNRADSMISSAEWKTLDKGVAALETGEKQMQQQQTPRDKNVALEPEMEVAKTPASPKPSTEEPATMDAMTVREKFIHTVRGRTNLATMCISCDCTRFAMTLGWLSWQSTTVPVLKTTCTRA